MPAKGTLMKYRNTLLRRLRETAQLTQESLAEKVGCQPATISRLERRELKGTNTRTVLALSTFFGVSSSQLLVEE